MLNERREPTGTTRVEMADEFLASGMGVGSGTVEGPAGIVHSDAEISRVKRGDIVITPMADPGFAVAIHLLAGLVTDRGGMVSHAAILAREYQIPCIVGCRNATSTIADGRIICMDALAGVVMGRGE